jgi:hypothetical protein
VAAYDSKAHRSKHLHRVSREEEDCTSIRSL